MRVKQQPVLGKSNKIVSLMVYGAMRQLNSDVYQKCLVAYLEKGVKQLIKLVKLFNI